MQALDARGHLWQLGSTQWLEVPADAQADQRVWLACDGRVGAGFAFDEVLREGAQAMLAALKAEGVRVTLATGDSPARAHALAQRIGLDEVLAAATPQDKLDAVARAQAAGSRVVMVGDGVNDAPVLARADASLAMGQGALVSRSHADAVITSNRLQDLLGARRTAQAAMRIVRQNLAWAAAYNAVCIPLALVGWLPPWAAGLGMATSSLVVVLNALRAAR
jgi:Cu2+-exporting ATPase